MKTKNVIVISLFTIFFVACNTSQNPSPNDWRWKDILTVAISGIAFIISVITFYFTFFQRGTLKFWLPNIAAFQGSNKGRGSLFIILPVTVTNTGAVVHTVNYLSLSLVSKSDGKLYEFPMNSELDNIPPKRDPAIATSFSVSARSNLAKIISFSSYNPGVQILPGSFKLILYAWVDGKKLMTPQIIFETDLNQMQITSIYGDKLTPIRSLYEKRR